MSGQTSGCAASIDNQGETKSLNRISRRSGVKRMKSSWNGKVLAVCALYLLVAQIALAQSTAVAPRITQAVDETKLVTLAGNAPYSATAI